MPLQGLKRPAWQNQTVLGRTVGRRSKVEEVGEYQCKCVCSPRDHPAKGPGTEDATRLTPKLTRVPTSDFHLRKATLIGKC